MAHYDIFREQLAIKHPAYGHALWEPNPGRLYSPVEVGDVGYVREGKFHRLFNALLAADHPSHRTFGVPEYHVPLIPNPSEHIDIGTLKPSHCYSHGISVTPAEPDFHATPEDLPQASYCCPRRQRGAVSFLPVPAQRQDTIARGDFGRWIIKHIEIWLAFTRRLGLGIEQMEDIILVTGFHRTRSWANVAFLESQTDARVSFGVEVADADGPGINIQWRITPGRVRGAVLNWGPDGKDLPEDQCVFIRGFRVTRTLRILPKHLIAAAGPSSDPDEDNYEPGMELISIPALAKYRDPLHLLLEHITERAPDCDMVLVHDDDLARLGIDEICNSNEIFQPDPIMHFLQQSQPKIQQVQRDSLCADESSSMSGAETITVAMFSGEFQLEGWGEPDNSQKGHSEPLDSLLPSVQPPTSGSQPLPSHPPSECTEPALLSRHVENPGASSRCTQSRISAPQQELRQTRGNSDSRSRMTDRTGGELGLRGSSVSGSKVGSSDTSRQGVSETISDPVIISSRRLATSTSSVGRYDPPITNSDDVLSWTSQDPRQSLLFSPFGVVYKFETETNAQGQSTTTLWHAIRANRLDRVAKLVWAPGGGLGRAVLGKNPTAMADLVRRDPRMPNSRVFNGPDGFQYRWQTSTTSADIVLKDPNNNVIAFVRPTLPTRYQIGDVYAELHFVRSAGAGTVMHPPLMNIITVTAMLNRFAVAFNL